MSTVSRRWRRDELPGRRRLRTTSLRTGRKAIRQVAMSLGALGLGAPVPVGFGEKIWRINWGMVLVLSAIAGVGVVALYSAAGGRFEPWAGRHAMRYGMALGLALVVALIHPKVWL